MSVGSLQVCAGHEAGSEAAVHVIRLIFSEEDAANAFNCINRETFIHNTKIICPSIAIFVENCYNNPSRLFILGGSEIKSSEGTIQGDPMAMLIYAIAIIPLILRAVAKMESCKEIAKMVAFADVITGAGKIPGLKILWDFICKHGSDYGYFPQPEKTWLIVKPHLLDAAKKIFEATAVKITTEGQKHLGAKIGSKQFKNDFVTKRINEWTKDLIVLAQLTKYAPQEAYTCFTSGYKHKISYLMRTISDVSQHLQTLDDIVTLHLLPAITGGITVNQYDRALFSLQPPLPPPSMGGLEIPI